MARIGSISVARSRTGPPSCAWLEQHGVLVATHAPHMHACGWKMRAKDLVGRRVF
jgi:hypothetical protein